MGLHTYQCIVLKAYSWGVYNYRICCELNSYHGPASMNTPTLDGLSAYMYSLLSHLSVSYITCTVSVSQLIKSIDNKY